MKKQYTILAAATVLLATTLAGAGTNNLYDGLGTRGYWGNMGDPDNGTTGQKFNASNLMLGANAIPSDATIDRVAMKFSIDPNKPAMGDPGRFQFRVRLWTWNTNFATTVAGTPLADSGVLEWPGGFDGWVQLGCSQPASGTYFIGVTCLGRAANGQWRVAQSDPAIYADDSVAYAAGTQDDSREIQVQVHWYNASCAAAAVAGVTGIAGNVVATGTNPHTITLTGTNLDTLTAASLVRRHVKNGSTTIAGTLAAAVPPNQTSRQVSFNLTGAEGGLYDLQLTQACDRIANAFDGVLTNSTLIPLKNAVLVYMPTLTNAGFESAWNDNPIGGFCSSPRGKDLEEPKHWGLGINMGGAQGSQWRRDGAVLIPGCSGTTPAGGDGLHYASFIIPSVWPMRNSTFQTIAAPEVVGGVAQKGLDFQVAYLLSSGTDQLILRLRDGSNTGPVIAQKVLNTSIWDGTHGLLFSDKVTLNPGTTFTSNPPLLTVELEHNSDGTFSSAHAVHIDSLQMTLGCNQPWADADDDGDVDMNDFAAFQRCYSPQAAIPTDVPYCSCFDQVTNGHIDEADFSVFTDCATGPGVAWVSCAP